MPFYSPGPVPLDMKGLPAYLNNEFERISNVLSGAVKLAFGGLFQEAPTFTTVLTPVPIIFDPYDTELPIGSEPQGTIPDLTTGTITILTAGIFQVSFSTTGINIPPNAEYDFVATVNGVPGPAGGAVDPSNQTDRVTIAFSGIVAYVRGDVLAVEVASPSSDDWESANAQFLVTRISDAQD